MRQHKSYFDKMLQDRKFKLNNEVLVLLQTDNNKLLSQWKGPYKVLDKCNAVRNKPNIFNANMLKLYHRRATVQHLHVTDDCKTSEKVARCDHFAVVQASLIID